MEQVASLQRLQEHKCPRLHNSTLVNLVLPLCFRKASLWHPNFGKLRQKQLLRVGSLALGIQQVHVVIAPWEMSHCGQQAAGPQQGSEVLPAALPLSKS